jgi:hypothetical protein
MKVKNYSNFSFLSESKIEEDSDESVYGDICVLLDALGVPCEISKIDQKVPNKKIVITLKNDVFLEIEKDNKDDIFSLLKVYQNKEDYLPCLTFKNYSGSGSLIFDFESDGIPEISEDISFSDFLSNDSLRSFLVKKSFKLLGQKDFIDLKSHYDDLICKDLEPSDEEGNLYAKRFLNVLGSFISPLEMDFYRNL